MADKSVNLTPRELEILVAFVTEVKGEVDWNKVAEKAKCSTTKYARDKFGLIRNKLAASVDPTQTNSSATPKPKSAKKATPGKRKRADGEDDDEEATPTKKKATPRKPKRATPAKEKSTTPAEGDDDDEAKAVIKDEAKAVIKDEPIEPDEPNGAGELMDDMETGA